MRPERARLRASPRHPDTPPPRCARHLPQRGRIGRASQSTMALPRSRRDSRPRADSMGPSHRPSGQARAPPILPFEGRCRAPARRRGGMRPEKERNFAPVRTTLTPLRRAARATSPKGEDWQASHAIIPVHRPNHGVIRRLCADSMARAIRHTRARKGACARPFSCPPENAAPQCVYRRPISVTS